MSAISVAQASTAQARLEDIVARHLQRFAFREPLQLGWLRG